MKKLASWLKEQKITEVEAVISDFTGIARGKIMPSNKFIAEKGIRLPESVLIQGVTGDYVDDEVYDDLISAAEIDMGVVPLIRQPGQRYQGGQYIKTRKEGGFMVI